MKTLECINCGSTSEFSVVYEQNFEESNLSPEIFSARRTTEHWHYRLVRCNRCTQLFSNPVLEPERIYGLYKESSLSYDPEIRNIASSYRQPLIRRLPPVTATTSALEVGCGSGFFLEELTRLGFKEVVGIEPSKDAVQKAEAHIAHTIMNLTFEEAASSLGKFDLICCFHTLDHLIDPLSVLSGFYKLLNDRGLCYIVVHDEKALQARILGERSPIFDVEHIYLFNESTVRNLFEKAGFKNIVVTRLWNTYSLDYWLRMTPLSIARVARTFVQKIGAARLPITIPAGNLAIFATRQH